MPQLIKYVTKIIYGYGLFAPGSLNSHRAIARSWLTFLKSTFFDNLEACWQQMLIRVLSPHAGYPYIIEHSGFAFGSGKLALLELLALYFAQDSSG